MFGIYVIQINDILDNQVYNRFLQFVSDEKKERIKRFHFIKDAQRSLFGDIIARYALCKNTGIKNNDLLFNYNQYKKPIFKNIEGIHFNISHAGDWVVCAIDVAPVGIDVEFIKPIDFSIAKRFFSKYEYETLMSKDDIEKTEYFYQLWTLKESYIKAIGTGLSTPLDSFWFKIDDDNIILETDNENPSCHFKQYRLDANHFMAVCCQSNRLENTPTIECLDYDRLYNVLL